MLNPASRSVRRLSSLTQQRCDVQEFSLVPVDCTMSADVPAAHGACVIQGDDDVALTGTLATHVGLLLLCAIDDKALRRGSDGDRSCWSLLDRLPPPIWRRRAPLEWIDWLARERPRPLSRAAPDRTMWPCLGSGQAAAVL